MRARWVAVLIVLAGCMQPAPDGTDTSVMPPAPDNDLVSHLQQLATFPELRIETDHGTIRAILYEGWTPQTAQHVGGLAEDGFYDGLLIHRVVDDFVIQSGDPTGTGEGGSGPGGLSTNTVPLEIHPGLDFGSGAVGLARWTDDTGDSQWFITEKPALHLSRPSGPTGEVFGAYSLFGQVFEGMDVVRQIAAVETLPNDRPVEDVHVQKAELLPPPSDADLIGLIPAIAVGEGILEAPRWIVGGHAFTIRYTRDDDCGAEQQTVRLRDDEDVALQKVADDACTWEGEVVSDVPSMHIVGPGGESLAWTEEPATGHLYRWVPWHDDYAAFTGNVTNPT